MADLQKQIEKETQALFMKRHELTYNDSQLKVLQQDIADLEKKLADRRRTLDAQLALNPEVKALDLKRKNSFKALSELQEKEQLIQNEIKAAAFSSGKAK